jgi:hypothetical protein
MGIDKRRMAMDILPQPIVFGYNRLVTVQTVREFMKQPGFSLVDSIAIIGSSFKPHKESTGKDIDICIFLKEGTTDAQKLKLDKKVDKIFLKNQGKYGVSFDILPWGGAHVTVRARTRKGVGALKTIKSYPHKLLYACPNSWVKFHLSKRRTTLLPRKRPRPVRRRIK